MDEAMKICTSCSVEKKLDEFYARPRAPDGRRNDCKECFKSRVKRARDADPEKNKRQCRNWHKRNRDTQLAAFRTYYQVNAEKLRAEAREHGNFDREGRATRARRWRQKNPEHAKQLIRYWVAAHPERVAAINARRRVQRRAANLQAIPTWANLEAIDAIYERAREIAARTGIPHDVDHIVPLQSPTVCGLHNEFNLRVLPKIENIRKGNRHWPDMPELQEGARNG